MPLIKEWQNRPLHSIYAVVFMDAIHFNIKQDGIDYQEGFLHGRRGRFRRQKDVLGIWIGKKESAKFWLSVLNELKTAAFKTF
jgi:putative transposase